MNKAILKGADISEFNGALDFEVIKENLDFVILRCGFGSDYLNQDDEYFERNAKECEKLGIPYGVYLYSYADTKAKALSEAKHVLRLIKDKTPLCGVWYDVEDKIMPTDKNLLSDICALFCEEIEKNGHYVGIYANLSWFNTRFVKEKIAPYDKWLAQWNEKDEMEEAHGMWQYTSKGKINGLNGDFDLNVAYKNYPEIIKNMYEKQSFRVRIKAKGGLNIRKGPGTEYNITGALSDGRVVKVISASNGWGKLLTGGYISMNYTEKYEDLSPGEYILTAENESEFIEGKEKGDNKSETILKIKEGKKVNVTAADEYYAKISISEEVFVPTQNLKKA